LKTGFWEDNRGNGVAKTININGVVSSNIFWAIMADFRWATVFVFATPLLKARNDFYIC